MRPCCRSIPNWMPTCSAFAPRAPLPAALAADVHGYTTCFYWAGAIFVIAAICAFGLLRPQARPPTPGVPAEAKPPAAEPAAG